MHFPIIHGITYHGQLITIMHNSIASLIHDVNSCMHKLLGSSHTMHMQQLIKEKKFLLVHRTHVLVFVLKLRNTPYLKP